MTQYQFQENVLYNLNVFKNRHYYKKTTEFQDFSIISYVYVHTKNHIAQQNLQIKLNSAQA